jgi:hypothetical protein
MSRTAKIVMGVLVLIPSLYVCSCGGIEHRHEHAFARVKEGDTEQQVIAVMGEPTDRETPSNRLAKYGAPECQAPCVQRLWYPNKLSLAGEAWSVDLDAAGHVVHTAHLVSP